MLPNKVRHYHIWEGQETTVFLIVRRLSEKIMHFWLKAPYFAERKVFWGWLNSDMEASHLSIGLRVIGDFQNGGHFETGSDLV